MSELRFDDVSVRYGRTLAVDGVSLTVPAGQVVGLVGESGSGKSTLARAAVGLAPLSGGSITLDGAPVPTRGRIRPLQMVFQDPYSSLNPRMTIAEVVGEGLAVHEPGLDRRARRERSTAALAEVGLDADVLDRYPRSFSGGQRQRMAIARAMVLRPAVLVCDEPVSALDVSVQAQVVDLLRRTRVEHGTAVLFIAHDLAVVQQLCDRVAVVHAGRVVETGSVAGVYGDPQEQYTRDLLAAVPVPDPPVERARRAAARAARTAGPA